MRSRKSFVVGGVPGAIAPAARGSRSLKDEACAIVCTELFEENEDEDEDEGDDGAKVRRLDPARFLEGVPGREEGATREARSSSSSADRVRPTNCRRSCVVTSTSPVHTGAENMSRRHPISNDKVPSSPKSDAFSGTSVTVTMSCKSERAVRSPWYNGRTWRNMRIKQETPCPSCRRTIASFACGSSAPFDSSPTDSTISSVASPSSPFKR
mmetsp:Transcript_9828/g.31154  ORF Transcript_9828/g.31154 Transcript_9828/m.31154 type:complete len:211 (+) Transcript_9828:1854-2486(+)